MEEFFQFLVDTGDGEVSGLQCLLLCGETNFEKAFRRLETNFEFVIPLPCLVQAPPILAKAFEWPFVPQLHCENTTDHDQTMAELSEGMIATLSARMLPDRQLYEYAERRWSERPGGRIRCLALPFGDHGIDDR
jgi:hypothetical protein